MTDIAFLRQATLALTAQTDSHGLACALIGALESAQWAASVVLLEVYSVPAVPGDGRAPAAGAPIIRRFDAELGLAHRQPPDLRGVHEALGGDTPVLLEADQDHACRIVIPVRGRDNPRRLLVIDAPTDAPQERINLLYLVEMFGNQLALLDSRERDQLTGLLNRQAFTKCYLQLADPRALALGAELWLAVLDIDHFKRVNDGFGHLIGDEVLLRVARLMEMNFRYSDRLFRFGGEEFLVLMRGDASGTQTALERLRGCIAGHSFPAVGGVTISAGYACAMPGMLAPDVVDIADRALYQAKRNGRNRVEVASPPVHTRPAGTVELF